MAESGLVRIENDVFASGRFRTPVCICIDVSASMREIVDGVVFDTGRIEMHDGEVWKVVEGGVSRMQKTVEFLKEFKRVLLDNGSEESVDLCIVTFSDYAQVVMDFTPINAVEMPKSFNVSGGTDLGSGLQLALKELNDRKALYKSEGVEYYQPIMVVMSDGEANGNQELLNEMCLEIHKQEESKRLSTFPIVLDDKSARASLDKISHRHALGLKSEEFSAFFQWLSQSIDSVSSSTPGETVKLPQPDFAADWVEL